MFRWLLLSITLLAVAAQICQAGSFWRWWFHFAGSPKWMVYNGNPFQLENLGVPPTSGNLHMMMYLFNMLIFNSYVELLAATSPSSFPVMGFAQISYPTDFGKVEYVTSNYVSRHWTMMNSTGNRASCSKFHRAPLFSIELFEKKIMSNLDHSGSVANFNTLKPPGYGESPRRCYP